MSDSKNIKDLPKNYDPKEVEPKLVEAWIESGLYKRSEGKEDVTLVIPPPNVTGVLHMGHAMDDTIQDTYVRYSRMAGKSTRWIIGLDHAGIATQTKVDKSLKEKGIDRREIGREKFIDACWDWTHEYGGTIVKQIKRMGCSCDFDDQQFTMSDEFSHAVRQVFVDWYHDGIIYRGKRIVNWCPSCTTAISDDEAEYKDEHGHLWYLNYPLKESVNGIDHITVATTRPETMLGDTGVAVSASDDYAKQFIGATVVLPIVNREIPIFDDWHVDAGFGTGFVKVTPAHDPNDFAMGEAHGLEKINIMDETAHIVSGYGEFSGMDRDEARVAIVKWFEDHGLLDHIEELDHSVMHCYRCGSALEPWLSEQWFVAVDKLKKPAIDAVKSGAVKFHPKRWTDTYLTWMDNLKDWCISRQLWWGHRIPVFTCEDCGWEDATMEDVDICPKCGSKHVVQDPDVLDTWFSSQLFPFATQGWPTSTEFMKDNYPTQALVTARDIIALWVARMIMSSLYFTKEIPFKDVVIYATILAKDGSRMSKSKGNGVDPMDLMEKYGADAMRQNLLTLITNNQDVRFDAEFDKKTGEFISSPRTEQAKAFVTKIWNAVRFALMNMDGHTLGTPSVETREDAWMFSRLAKQTKLATNQLENYEFGEYARGMQSFFWNEICDWYIELCKSRLLSNDEKLKTAAQRNLVYVLDVALRLLHPSMPFVTEALWSILPASSLDEEDHEGKFLMSQAWPKAEELSKYINEEAEHSFELAKRIIGGTRAVRARYRLSPKQDVDVSVKVTVDNASALNSMIDFIKSVGHISNLTIASSDFVKPAKSISFVDDEIEAYVVLDGLIDFNAEVKHLETEINKIEKDLNSVTKTLSNEGFIAKASPEIIDDKKQKQQDLTSSLELLKSQLRDLS